MEYTKKERDIYLKLFDNEKALLAALQTDKDIIKILSFALNDFFDDGNIHNFYKALACSVKVKGKVNEVMEALNYTETNFYSLCNGKITPDFEEVTKIVKILGYKFEISVNHK